MSRNRWVRNRVVGWMCGRGVEFGVGQPSIYNPPSQAMGKWGVTMDVTPYVGLGMCDDKWTGWEEGSLDWVIVGERLVGLDDPSSFLRAAALRLKCGGHLIVVVPMQGEEPRVRWKFTPNMMREMVGEFGGWIEKGCWENEGWLLVVFKKGRGRRGVCKNVETSKPKACVVRYGALGDMIMVTPLLRKLSEDGYHVTVNATPYSIQVLDNNPYVDNLIVQEREAIPNAELGDYWDYWKTQYDRFINLSESVEGSLLKVEGRRAFFTHKDWRHRTCNYNYYDWTMKMGGYPGETGRVGELYISGEEKRWAHLAKKDRGGDWWVMWALSGSSHHKVYPLMEPVMVDWLKKHPNARLVTVGDDTTRLLEFEHPQVWQRAGQWSIRQSLAMVSEMDVVVGPESMIINASGCFDEVGKVPLLSHSTHENLCKYFKKDYCLAPDTSIAPCYPCHQLHYTRESCVIGGIVDEGSGEEMARGPICAMGAIQGERVLERLEEIYTTYGSV